MLHFIRLFSILLLLSFTIISQISFANLLSTPNIDENGRLILPNPVQLPKLPTDSKQFFEHNNAYEYGAKLYIQEVGIADKTAGYTLYNQRAYNEIESVLGHTPRWEIWADKIKKVANSGTNFIEIAGHLTTDGIQKKGDYLGYARFRPVSQFSTQGIRQAAFTEILPEIRAHNLFVDQLENLNLSPQDRVWLHQAYLDRKEQVQPNEDRAPYDYDFENQDKSQRKSRNDRYSERQRPTDFGDLDDSGQYPKPIDDLVNLRVNGEAEIGYTAGLGVIGQMSSGYARDTGGNICRTETACVGLGPMAEVSVGVSGYINTGTLTENSSSWSVTIAGGTTIGYGGGLSGSVGIDGSLSGGVGGKTGFGAGGAILVCKKEISECQKAE